MKGKVREEKEEDKIELLKHRSDHVTPLLKTLQLFPTLEIQTSYNGL